jgi:hypothetical protein
MLGENVFAVISANTNTKDGMGAFTSTSKSVILIRGKFEKFKSEELNYNGRDAIVADYVFYCNYNPKLYLDESMTIIVHGRNYAVSFVENVAMENVTTKIYLRTL